MKTRIPVLIVVLLAAGALPLAGQERPAPPAREPLLLDRTPGPPPPIERLESLRLERLQEALDLTDEQTATLRRELGENRAAMREAFERQHAAMEALRESLKDEPVDQASLRRALADVEAARAEMERRRERQMAELGRTLSVEQRAKFLLFNRQFDARLRELVERRRAPASPGRQGQFPMRVVPPRDLDHRMPVVPPRPGYERREPSREERIEMLERRIGELQRELEELREAG